MKDLYEIIGISRTATAEEIKKAYRKLAQVYHPDKNPGDKEMEAKFKELNNAYEILGDDSKRRHYDTYGNAPSVNQNRNHKPFTNVMDDFFGNFFNQRRASYGEEHINAFVNITLEQAYKGEEVEVKFERNITCQSCHGLGGEMTKCSSCNGAGFNTIVGGNHTIRTSCHDCQGVGKKITNQCSDCKGSGVSETKQDSLKFMINPGVENGMRFAHAGLGNVSTEDENVRGNLYITVNIQEHEMFKRMPNGNLFLEMPVSYSQLVLGDEVELPNLSGKKIKFKIPKGTQDGSNFRLAQMGMPIFNNSSVIYKWGDQLVQVKLEVPKNLDEEHEKIIEKIAKIEKKNLTPLRSKFKEKLEGVNGRN